jgi:hypothetical protein
MHSAFMNFWVVLLFVTGGCAEIADFTTDHQAIAIGVYDYTHIAKPVLARAESETTSMFGRFGVHLTWAHCVDRGSVSPCRPLLGPGFITLNLVGRSMGSRIALNDRKLGVTLGKRIYILYQPIQDTIGDKDPERCQILAHIIAHELGHVLLPPKAHSDKGIMRSSWRLRDLQNEISFTSEEEKQIRVSVVGLKAQP